MTDGQRHDIEIYVLRPEPSKLMDWLSAVVGDLELVDEMDEIRIYRSVRTGVAVTVTPGVENGPFTSVMFAGRNIPWKRDAACARDAARSLAALVRCTPDTEAEGDDWLQIDASGERIVSWDTPI